MKKAYPNFNDFMPASNTYDLGKWMSAMKDIYIKLHLGASKNDAVKEVASDWNAVEKREFLDWLKYYESGDVSKYKKAQYYVNDDINYFMPNPAKAAPSPIKNINNEVANINNDALLAAQKKQQEEVAKHNENLAKEEKRKIIEDQRRKILGRLNSAERLLSSHQGQEFAGAEFEKLLSAIYELKKQIQTVNKITLSAQTIVDLIIRQANILNRSGNKQAAHYLVKFAQNTPGDFSMNLGETPVGGSQENGAGALANNPPDLSGEKNTPIDAFLDNLESSGLTDADELDKDTNPVDDVEIEEDVFMADDGGDLVVEAQALPENDFVEKPVAPPIPKKRPTENLEVEDVPNNKEITTEEVVGRPKEIKKNDFDALIDAAFGNLTIQDVINKLEDINEIFRTREISRQLNIVDLMLNKLNLASFVPELAETTNRTISNDLYCLTRISDVLGKLRGTISASDIDINGEDKKSPHPEAENARNILEQDEIKEQKRKEMNKKKKEQEALQELKPEPKVEAPSEDIAAAPTKIEQPIKQPVI